MRIACTEWSREIGVNDVRVCVYASRTIPASSDEEGESPRQGILFFGGGHRGGVEDEAGEGGGGAVPSPPGYDYTPHLSDGYDSANPAQH
jgi:hypothetical protein